MADKTTKRKAYDIPVLSDLDEVVQITPAFSRRTKSRNPGECKASTSVAETLGNAQKLPTKPRDKNDQIPAPCIIETKVGEAVFMDLETIHNEAGASTSDRVSSGSDSSKKPGRVGSNFLETFAFIEKTKHYEAPQSKPSTSKSSETLILSSSSRLGQEQSSKPHAQAPKPNSVIVNQRQKGNPVLKFFRNIPWEYGDIVPDYVMGQRICALFLSIRYHQFNPDYIHERLKQLGHRYEVTVLLVQVDIKDPHKTLKELTKMTILADCTLMLAWSPEEAARYIEMYKIYENKPPDALQGQTSTDYLSKLTDCLTSVKSVNKTDTVTLLSTFESLENIISASKDDMALCPGFGPQKAKRLQEAFHQPFLMSKKTVEQSGDKQSKT